MDLFEYQGKQFFAQYGMSVSPGEIAFTVDEAVAAAERLGTPVMVKAQVLTGGRGKAGTSDSPFAQFPLTIYKAAGTLL